MMNRTILGSSVDPTRKLLSEKRRKKRNRAVICVDPIFCDLWRLDQAEIPIEDGREIVMMAMTTTWRYFSVGEERWVHDVLR